MDADPEQPSEIGPYRILDTLGSGGMSIVYRAEQTSLEREIAVKMLSPESSRSPEAAARFERESQLVASLSHPGIIQIIDRGLHEGQYFIAMEYVRGCSLEDLLRERDLSIEEVVDIGRQIAEAMHYAHSKGVVHRDIKPGNILVSSESGLVKVADFGIAQLAEAHHLSGDTITRANIGMGTVDYMAPEQRLSARDVDGRADIFAFGIMLYEMLTKRLPLGHFKPPEQHRDDTPPALSKVVMRCLQESPDDRYADFGQVVEQLSDITLVNVQYREALGRVAETVRRVSGKASTGLRGHYQRGGVLGVLRALTPGRVLAALRGDRADGEPRSSRALLGIGAVLLLVGVVAFTLQGIDFERLNGGPYAEAFLQAEKLQEAGEAQAALEALRAIRTEASEIPENKRWEAEAQWRVAEIHRERKSTRSAAIAYGYFAREFPPEAQAERLPDALYWAGHFRQVQPDPDADGAVFFFARLYEEFPENERTPEALVRAGQLMADSLRVPRGTDDGAWYRRIASLHERVLSDYPDSPDRVREVAYQKLGELYEGPRAVRDYARAADNYEALAEQFPDSEYAERARNRALRLRRK